MAAGKVTRFAKLYEWVTGQVSEMVTNDVDPDVWETLTGEPKFREWCKDAVDERSETRKKSLTRIKYATAGAVIYSLPNLGNDAPGPMKHSAYERRKMLLEHVNDWCVDQTHLLAMLPGCDAEIMKTQMATWARSGHLTRDGRWKFAKHKDWQVLTRSWNKAHPDDTATPSQLRERYKTALESFLESRYMISRRKVEGLVLLFGEMSSVLSIGFEAMMLLLDCYESTDSEAMSPEEKDKFDARVIEQYDETARLIDRLGSPEVFVAAWAAWLPYIQKSADEQTVNKFTDAMRALVKSHFDFVKRLEAHVEWCENPLDRAQPSNQGSADQDYSWDPAWSIEDCLTVLARLRNGARVPSFSRMDTNVRAVPHDPQDGST